MNIQSFHPDENNLARVQARFYEVADARGVPREEAVIAAMVLWIGSDATTWVTDEEWRELAPELERIRARGRARSESTGKEPGL